MYSHVHLCVAGICVCARARVCMCVCVCTVEDVHTNYCAIFLCHYIPVLDSAQVLFHNMVETYRSLSPEKLQLSDRTQVCYVDGVLPVCFFVYYFFLFACVFVLLKSDCYLLT